MGEHLANLFVRAYAHLADSAHEVTERQAASTPGMYRALVQSGAYLEADQFASLPMPARRKFCALMASTAPLMSRKAEYPNSDVLQNGLQLYSTLDLLKVCEGNALAEQRPLEKMIEPVLGDLEAAFEDVTVENEAFLSLRSKEEFNARLRTLKEEWDAAGEKDVDALHLAVAQEYPVSARHWKKDIAEFMPGFDDFEDEYFEEPEDGGWDDAEYAGIEYDGEPDWAEEPEDDFEEQDEEPDDDEEEPEAEPAEPEETDTGDMPGDGGEEPEDGDEEEPVEQDEEPGDDDEGPEDEEPGEEEDVVHYMTYGQRMAGRARRSLSTTTRSSVPPTTPRPASPSPGPSSRTTMKKSRRTTERKRSRRKRTFPRASHSTEAT